MKIFKTKSLKLYLIISLVIFVIFFIILFFYLSTPNGGVTYTISDTKTFLVNAKKGTNTFKYELNLNLEKTLKDIKFYQYKEGESVELRSKAIQKYSLDTTKLPSIKIIGNKSITLFNDHVDIFNTVQLSEGNTTIYDTEQKLKDIISKELLDLGVSIPEEYTIRKSFLHDDGFEASAVSKETSNILSMSLIYIGETDPSIKININQNGDVQRIVLLDKISNITKEEINTNVQILPSSYYIKTRIDDMGSFDSYLPNSTREISVSEIIYLKTKDNLLVPFLRLSDVDNTVSIVLPVIDPTRIIYQ